jgi:hypothetical protein
VAEVDTGYFGAYLKPANLKQDRVDRRLVRIKPASARPWS